MTTDETILDELLTKLESSSTLHAKKDDDDDRICCPKEKFHEVDGGAALYNDGLLAKYCFRALSKYPIIYGYKRYSYGTHQIRFQIEKRGDLRSFFGIMSSLDKVSRVISTDLDNRSLYGWWELNSIVTNGKVKRSKEKNDIEKNDELTLTLKCDQQQIELEHHRTKRLLKLSVDILLCPFPWKIVVELPTYGEYVRIVQ
ncbi:unnamed protein product [Rotaria socialis]|uniref:Uncharacterized protein n=1 Tax=Rotaria socialis TaxID=392032 RepID=A0A820MRS3_9BILA|nr:unnamed protein product [Rotaria socialis]CAF4376655.1 unnamed protein product [Rotaria socialis]